ncbi:unnamed protein product [Camellia sinensis]
MHFFELVFKSEVRCKFRKFSQLTFVPPDVFEVFPRPSRGCYMILAPRWPIFKLTQS